MAFGLPYRGKYPKTKDDRINELNAEVERLKVLCKRSLLLAYATTGYEERRDIMKEIIALEDNKQQENKREV